MSTRRKKSCATTHRPAPRAAASARPLETGGRSSSPPLLCLFQSSCLSVFVCALACVRHESTEAIYALEIPALAAEEKRERKREEAKRKNWHNKREKLWRFSFLFPFDLSPPPPPSPLHFQITHAHTHNSIFLHYTRGGMNIFFVKSTQDKGGKRKGTHNRERASLSLPPSLENQKTRCVCSLSFSLSSQLTIFLSL